MGMVGRSTIMKESFRSTKPISEFALNVLYSLQPPETDPDHKELIEKRLIEKTVRNGETWWEVRFNQIDGPNPILKKFSDLAAELIAIEDYVFQLISKERVQPQDIVIITPNRYLCNRVQELNDSRIGQIYAYFSHQTGQGFQRDERTIIVTTPHSFKGFEAEIVVIAGVDQFNIRRMGIHTNALYVAMTRARSILAIFGKQSNQIEIVNLFSVFDKTLDLLLRRYPVQPELSPIWVMTIPDRNSAEREARRLNREAGRLN